MLVLKLIIPIVLIFLVAAITKPSVIDRLLLLFEIGLFLIVVQGLLIVTGGIGQAAFYVLKLSIPLALGEIVLLLKQMMTCIIVIKHQFNVSL